MDKWTKAERTAALAEGWNVFTVDSYRMEIQRLDAAEIFASDEAALAHVRKRAAAGSELHRRALIATVTT